jgi:putative phosphoribosyl transferase
MVDSAPRSRYADRTEAGRRLGTALAERDVDADVVLAIPRGGVPVGRAVADELDLPLDVVVTAKIGAPTNSELAIGAVGSDREAWIDWDTVSSLGIDRSYVTNERARVADTAAEKAARYRGSNDPRSLVGESVLIVDDGAATGSTAIAAVRLARDRGADRVVVALPVAPPDAAAALREVADEVLCLLEPSYFRALGQFYEDFGQVSDEEAIALLEEGAVMDSS